MAATRSLEAAALLGPGIRDLEQVLFDNLVSVRVQFPSP